MNASPLIAHYRAYFSEAYADLKQAIADQLERISRAHAGDVPAAFERAVRVLVQTREFWRQFTEVQEISLDTAAIARAWKAARDGLVEALRSKQAAPLDRVTLPGLPLRLSLNMMRCARLLPTFLKPRWQSTRKSQSSRNRQPRQT